MTATLHLVVCIPGAEPELVPCADRAAVTVAIADAERRGHLRARLLVLDTECGFGTCSAAEWIRANERQMNIELFSEENLCGWKREWVNMPEYSTQDLSPAYQIVMSCPTKQDVVDLGMYDVKVMPSGVDE